MIWAKQRRATRSVLLLATVVAVVLSAWPVFAADEDVAFEGAGWGHGVGMSQWGAYAQSTAGRSYQQILAFYYVGTSIENYDAISPGHPNLKVNLEGDRTDLMLRVLKTGSAAQVPATVSRGSDVIALTSNQSVRLVWAGPNQCTFEFREGSNVATAPFATWAAGSCLANIAWDGDSDAPTTMIEIAGCFLYDWNSGSSRACRYSRGSLQTIDNTGRDSDPGVDLVLDIDIDAYVLGISEVSYFWPTEALKAQAVAARSYAAEAIDRLNPAPRACACDVLDTAGDQRYVGFGHGIQKWIDAVNATDNQVLTHPAAPRNGIVSTFYSSSNGGASEARHEKWGGSPTPWLPSVPDPWSLQPPNPRASWKITVNPATLAAKVWGANPPALASVRVTQRNTSGSAKTVEFRAANGAVATRSSAWVTSAAGLYSWYFDVDYTVGPPPNAKATQHDQVALQDPRTGVWHLRYGDGRVDSYYYGNPKDTPYAGDWNGDGIDTMGLYRESTGFLFLRNTNTQGVADVSIYYGNPGDKPIAGDWNGDGVDTVGIYRPSQSRFYLRNTNTQGVADIDFAFGQPGDVPIAGDWNGDGVDTVGVFRPSNKTVYLLDDFADATPDIVFTYSGTAAGDRIVVGDWDGDGDDTVGVFRPSTATWYLRDSFTQQSANIVFVFGDGHMNPVAGDWGG
jgi:SpoIID/LytB domain protein